LIKKLLGQTALYGISSVLVRIFPFLIAPIITRAFSPAESAPFVDWYSIAGVVTVFLTHGMETSFFRFAQEKDISKETLNIGLVFSVDDISAQPCFYERCRKHIAEVISIDEHTSHTFHYG